MEEEQTEAAGRPAAVLFTGKFIHPRGTKNGVWTDSDKMAAEFSQQLSKGLKASEPLMRQYCIDAVAYGFGQQSSNEKVSILGQHLSQLTDLNAGPIETFSTLQHLESLADPKDSIVAASTARAFALAISAQDNNDLVRRYSLQALAFVVKRPGFPTAATVLKNDEPAALHAGLDHVVKPEDEWAKEKAVVVKWLSE